MENAIEVSLIKPITAPLPPPPPPPFIINSAKPQNLKSKNILLPNTTRVPINEQTTILQYVYPDTDAIIVSQCKPLQSVIQDGPSCGIVALSMASQFFKKVDAPEILAVAKQLNFSKSGEIFSAHNMAKLAYLLLDCDGTVITDLKNHKNMILSHLCDGFPMLMPYDPDKNHEPGFNNGRSAHWAVLCGLCFELPKDFELDYEVISGLKIHISNHGELNKNFLNVAKNIHVYAYQGKSRHMGLWDLDHLLNSNNNMYEITQKYESDNLVLPEDKSLSELRDKAVILKN